MSAGRILVTGAGGPAGRSLCLGLLERGVEVVGVDMAPVALPGVPIEPVPAADDAAFLGELRRLAVDHAVDAVVPTVSEELVPLARQRERSVPGEPPALVCGARAATLAADKWLTCRALAAAGVAVPTHALAGDPGATASLVASLGSAIVSKPRAGRGARGVVVHRSPGAAEIDRLDDRTILQELVPGTEYAVNLYEPDRHGPSVAVVLEKLALTGGEVGNATAVRRVEDGDVATVALDALRAIGLVGPADVDVRRRADGTPVVLEVNARFGAHHLHAPEVLDALLAERFAPLALSS